MIVIVDYGVGNLFSLKSSLAHIGEEVLVSNKAADIEKADKIILPGVGAFADAIAKLKKNNLDEVVCEAAKKGTPLLGICLGMQLLLDKSYEYGEHGGLGLIKGDIVPIEGAVPEDYKIPHIGWNGLHFPESEDKNPIFKYTEEGECVYFVHSYYAANCDKSVTATTEYGKELTAAVAEGNIYGVQFHPEKSGKVGLGILKAFCEL